MKDVKTIIKGVLNDFFEKEPVNGYSFLGVVVDEDDQNLLATAITDALEKPNENKS